MTGLLWMPDVLHDNGLAVREIPGWQTRGHGAMGDVFGVLCHHTAGPATGNYPSENVVVNGRPGLDGPLCNLGLARDGTWIVVANGQGWHAGVGATSWCPANTGNSHLIGVEAESVGSRNDWTPAQRIAYPRGVAALLRHLGLGSYRAIGHKEWAPGRKIDPAFWDMNSFRADVSRWMSTPVTPGSNPPAGAAAPAFHQEDEPMAPIPIAVRADGTFRATCMVEAGASSQVIARAWLTFGCTWGGARMKVSALDTKGAVMGRPVDIDVANNMRYSVEIPSGAVMATIEGAVHKDEPGALPAASLVTLSKAAS